MINKCKQCGRCCRELELEVVEIDLIREPRLRPVAMPINLDIQDKNNPYDRTYLLPTPCVFQRNNECMIYLTRPNLCVMFNDKCLSK